METHVPGADAGDHVSDIARWGWKAASTPARLTGRGGSSAGATAAVRAHIRAATFRHLADDPGAACGFQAEDPEAFGAGPIFFLDFTAVSLAVRSAQVTFIFAYFTDSIGLRAENLRKLAAVASFVHVLSGPWCLVADWNLDVLQRLG